MNVMNHMLKIYLGSLICLSLISCTLSDHSLIGTSPSTTSTEVLDQNNINVTEPPYFPEPTQEELVVQLNENADGSASTYESDESDLPLVVLTSNISYIKQTGTPIASINFLYPELGCNWLGVGGQVFDENGNPVIGLIVEAGGELADQQVLSLGITGGSGSLGPGGFEVFLLDHVVESRGTVWVQLYDTSGLPQSSPVYLDTYADCDKNLMILNFSKIGANFVDYFYFPVINK